MKKNKRGSLIHVNAKEVPDFSNASPAIGTIFEEFIALCDKYPHCKFIGNTKFNIWMIDKKYKKIDGFLLGAENALIDEKDNVCLYKNTFVGDKSND